MSEVTRILDPARHGEPSAADKLLPLVYQELRGLAAHKMAQEEPGHTLQPTALVHEAWLRLVTPEQRNRGKYTITGQPQVDDFSALLRSE